MKLMPDDFMECAMLGIMSIVGFIIIVPAFIIILPITLPCYFIGNFIAEKTGLKYKPFKDDED